MAQKYHFVILKKFRRGDYDGKSFKFIHRAEKEDLKLSERSLDLVLSDLVVDGKIVCRTANSTLPIKKDKNLPQRKRKKSSAN